MVDGQQLFNQMNTSPVNFRRASPKIHLSARKLAARLWQFRFIQLSSFPLLSNYKIESSPPRVRRSKEEALSEASNAVANRKRKQVVVSVLLSELLRAQRCIHKLKARHKSSKKKLEEEKLLWKRRQLHETRSVLDDLKDKLARERRSRERMESLNTKLLHQLAQAKLFAKEIMVNYEEEKRKRQLVEEVCNELAMQIGEDKTKLEGLQRHSVKILEEMEHERKMFQMAELWREESIQMKLLDAKLALEDKYDQMIRLIAHLQNFLSSRGDELNTKDLRDIQFIKQVAESVNIERITELTSDFTKSNDVFSIYEEFRKGKINRRVIQPDYPPNLAAPSSTIHIVSLDEDCQNSNFVLHQSINSGDYGTGLEVIADFCSPTQGRGTSLDNANQEKNILVSEAECYENADYDGCYKHYDSVTQRNSDDPTLDKCEGRLAKGSIQSGGVITSAFTCRGSGESGFKQWELLGQRNIADSANPHITRAMKGCIEWPRGSIPRMNSKVIPLEERVRKQKSQLQHILKPQA